MHFGSNVLLGLLCVPAYAGLRQLSRVLCDGFGHAVVGILCPSIVLSSRVLDFSVGLD